MPTASDADTFLDVLVPATFVREGAAGAAEITDYALPIPVRSLNFPDYVVTDCEWLDLLAAHLRPYLADAATHNGARASLGAFLAGGDDAAYVCFQQIYVGGIEFPSMDWLKTSVDYRELSEEPKQALRALIGKWHDAVGKAVAAAKGKDWLPPEYSAFARFYDDARDGWKNTLWFAHDFEPAAEDWLREQSFKGRVEWGRHPCNDALVVVFETEADAESFEARWAN